MSGPASWGFDAVLLASLVGLGWGSAAARDPFTAIVRYIAFGLLAALAWARLGAPDLALAEAAIGAGITGALLLSTLGRMGLRQASRESGEAVGSPAAPTAPPPPRARFRLVMPSVLAVLVALGLLSTVRSLSLVERPGLGPLVHDLQRRSGIESAVAAVLLDLRALDTLLEMAVLFAAVLAVWCLGAIRFRRPPWPLDPVLGSVARVLLPLLLVMAAYLLQAGLHRPGGGFQAGAVLGAAGVLWTLADRRALRLGERWMARWGLAFGLGALVGAGMLPVFEGRNFLEYVPGQAPGWAWFLELAIALSVGLTLTALFMGGLAEIREEGP